MSCMQLQERKIILRFYKTILLMLDFVKSVQMKYNDLIMNLLLPVEKSMVGRKEDLPITYLSFFFVNVMLVSSNLYLFTLR